MGRTNESDSSDEEVGDSTTTNVLLGYASRDPTEDPISQLGGRPSWLDEARPPSARLAKCKVCQGMMAQLLQLHGDLADRFPTHERRLHIFVCRNKPCRRKKGSIRVFRSVRITPSSYPYCVEESKPIITPLPVNRGLGNDVFGIAKAPSLSTNPNPFSTSSTKSVGPTHADTRSNPFANASDVVSTLSNLPPKVADHLPVTFAQKVSLSSVPPAHGPEPPFEPWPETSSMSDPFPSYHLDADYETLDDPSLPSASVKPTMDLDDGSGGESSTSKEDPETFESSIDKTFQRFADRLAQNPQQVLRYEFGGLPLLYSRTDDVGKLLAPRASPSTTPGKILTTPKEQHTGIPKCSNCGHGRVFELQVTPQAIAEVEVDETGLEGMDWGTLIVGVCREDCQARNVSQGQVGHVEEWVGVQWEEKGT